MTGSKYRIVEFAMHCPIKGHGRCQFHGNPAEHTVYTQTCISKVTKKQHEVNLKLREEIFVNQ